MPRGPATTSTPPRSSPSTSGPDAGCGTIQQVPHDRWGYDAASSPVLLDATVGRTHGAGRRAGGEDRLGLRPRPADRPAALPVRGLRAAAQPVHAAAARQRCRRGARHRGRSQLVAVRVRPVAIICSMSRPCICRPATSRTEARRPDGSVLEYASTQTTEESWGTLTALDLSDRGTDSLAGKGRRASGGRGPRDRRRPGVLRGGEGRLRRLPRGDRRGALVPPVRGRRECPAGHLQSGGRQYVAVAVGGNALFGFKQGDAVMAFALETP